MELRIAKTHPDAQLPTYGTEGAACFDFYAFMPGEAPKAVADGRPVTFSTGVRIEVPEGHVLLIYSRSGHGFNHDVRLANCTGVIDSDYTGPIMVKLAPDGPGYMEVKHGDRIAQGLLMPVERHTFTEVDDIKATRRGNQGMGSTGS